MFLQAELMRFDYQNYRLVGNYRFENFVLCGQRTNQAGPVEYSAGPA